MMLQREVGCKPGFFRGSVVISSQDAALSVLVVDLFEFSGSIVTIWRIKTGVHQFVVTS
jgi:hypothetical protein